MIFKIKKDYLESMENGSKTIELRSAKSFIEKLDIAPVYSDYIQFTDEESNYKTFEIEKLETKKLMFITNEEWINILQCEYVELYKKIRAFKDMCDVSDFDDMVLIHIKGKGEE